MTQPDKHFKPHNSASMRWLFFSLGWLSLLLGIVGIFLPVLPTTPFVLLAAALFARSSERFYNYLIHHKTFGPAIRDWRDKHCIDRNNKKVAYTIIIATFTLSILVLRERIYLVIMLASIMTSLLVLMYKIRNCD